MSTETSNEPVFAPLIVTWCLGWPVGAVRAVVAMKGWEWFVSDTFGLPLLSFIQTWGLFILISFATVTITDRNRGMRVWPAVFNNLFTSLFLSGFYFLSLWILSGWL